jgi:nucleotide-binding universal stress UspA family protein
MEWWFSLARDEVHTIGAAVILELVQANALDLLVMGTVGRTGVPGLLIGNTAERVLSKVECSVLA